MMQYTYAYMYVCVYNIYIANWGQYIEETTVSCCDTITVVGNDQLYISKYKIFQIATNFPEFIIVERIIKA